MSSSFMNEEEVSAMKKLFPESPLIRYDGGYPGCRKQKVFFLADEDDFYIDNDIVCLQARIDQRFRKISHRDVLGALMHLQIDRHSFGDFWIEEKHIYLYTSESMAAFLKTSLTRINQLNVSFEETDERPVQVFKTKTFTAVIASERIDAIVAGLVHCSRKEAKEMIAQGLVQVNHALLEHPDKVCNNNDTISIRGAGRFVFVGVLRSTKSDRIAAEFMQYV